MLTSLSKVKKARLSSLAIAISLAATSSAYAAVTDNQKYEEKTGFSVPQFELLDSGFLITQEVCGLAINGGSTFKLPGWQYSSVSVAPSMFCNGVNIQTFIDARDAIRVVKNSSLLADPTLLPNGAPVPSVGALPGIGVRLPQGGGWAFYFGKKSGQWIIGVFKDIKMPWSNYDFIYKFTMKKGGRDVAIGILAAIGNRQIVGQELKRGGAYLGVNIGKHKPVEEQLTLMANNAALK